MLQPSLSLVLGNLKYDSHIMACQVFLGLLPAINRAIVTLPAAVDISAATGDDASLEMLSDGDMTLVLTGKIGRIERRFHTTEVMIVDAGHALARTRTSATYEAQDSGKVIRNLAADASVDTSIIDAALPLVNYVASQHATAVEHIFKLAVLSGCIAHVTDDGRLQVITRPTGQPDLALLYGREFLNYSAREVQPAQNQLVLAGNGPAGNPSEPGAARHSSTMLPANAPAPGPTAHYIPTALLKTPAAASAAGQALNTARAATTVELTARCFLLPQLRPGQVVQVQGLPAGRPEGPWLVKGIDHTLKVRTAGKTVVTAELADLDAFGLGAALDFVGGLF